MARGWHYAKLSLSNAPRLSFPGTCILLFLFLSLCRFLCVCVFVLLSLELGRYVPLIFFCQTTYRIGNHVYYYWVWLRPDRLM